MSSSIWVQASHHKANTSYGIFEDHSFSRYKLMKEHPQWKNGGWVMTEVVGGHTAVSSATYDFLSPFIEIMRLS